MFWFIYFLLLFWNLFGFGIFDTVHHVFIACTLIILKISSEMLISEKKKFTPLESKRESLGVFIICGHMFYNAFGHVVRTCSSSNSFYQSVC